MAQTKVQAIQELMREARSDRKFTQTSITRASRSCVTLGLNRAETISIFNFLDACDVNGNPYRAGYSLNLPKE
jgi:hypothetical protein